MLSRELKIGNLLWLHTNQVDKILVEVTAVDILCISNAESVTGSPYPYAPIATTRKMFNKLTLDSRFYEFYSKGDNVEGSVAERSSISVKFNNPGYSHEFDAHHVHQLQNTLDVVGDLGWQSNIPALKEYLEKNQ